MDKFINAQHEKAYRLLQAMQLEEALKLYHDLVYLFPDQPDLFNDRGVIYIHLKEKEKSLSDFQQAISLQPDYGYRHAAFAYALDFFGDTKAAVGSYEKAIELDPDDAVSYNNLGLVQEKLGYQKKAKKNFETADELSKSQELGNLGGQQIEDQHAFQHQEIENNSTENISGITIETTPDPTLKGEFLKIFQSRKQFKEFVRFVMKGGKLNG